jgi:hypothetical protein
LTLGKPRDFSSLPAGAHSVKSVIGVMVIVFLIRSG